MGRTFSARRNYAVWSACCIIGYRHLVRLIVVGHDYSPLYHLPQNMVAKNSFAQHK